MSGVRHIDSVRRPLGVLYISYDGVLEPLGQSQVLAYLECLAAHASIHLITFEKADDWRIAAKRDTIAHRIAKSGISWHPLRYHKRPSMWITAYDIAHGICLGVYLVRRHDLCVVHARSYVASVMALVIKRLTGAHFIFDMRGFWADERVEGGRWPKGGFLYRTAKLFERRFLQRADAVVSLTRAALGEINTFTYLKHLSPPIFIIPTCVDLERFSVTSKPSWTKARFVLGYVGNVDGWYLFNEVVACFGVLKSMVPRARLLVANRGQHDSIQRHLSGAMIDTRDVRIVDLEHSQMPGLIRRMSAGIIMAKPSYSQLARAPTKLAEFLGCGVPCLASAGIGDVDAILIQERVGVLLGSYTHESRLQAVRDLVAIALEPDISARCARAAAKHFSLERGVLRYREIYNLLDRPKGCNGL